MGMKCGGDRPPFRHCATTPVPDAHRACRLRSGRAVRAGIGLSCSSKAHLHRICSALASMRATKRGAVHHDRTMGLSKRRGGIATAAAPKGNANGAQKFSIFSDENGAASAPSTAPGGLKVWSDLPAERVTTKENKGKAGKWNSKGVGGSKSSQPTKTFDVFDDGSGVVDESAGPSVRKGLNKKILRQCRDKAHTVTLKDFARARGNSRNTADGYLGYEPSPVFGSAEEMCFEEIRGAAWLEKNAIVLTAEDCAQDVEMGDEMGIETTAVNEAADVSLVMPTDQQPSFGAGVSAPQPTLGVLSDSENGPSNTAPAHVAKAPFAVFSDNENEASPQPLSSTATTATQGSRTFGAAVSPPASARAGYGEGNQGMPSPTINTKEAMADLMAMFSAPIGSDSPGSATPTSEAPAAVASSASLAAFGIFHDEEPSLSAGENPSSTASSSDVDGENLPPNGSRGAGVAPRSGSRSILGMAQDSLSLEDVAPEDEEEVLRSTQCCVSGVAPLHQRFQASTDAPSAVVQPHSHPVCVAGGTIVVDPRQAPADFAQPAQASEAGPPAENKAPFQVYEEPAAAPFGASLNMSAFPQVQ